MSKQGYWKNHKYYRHSVDREVQDFVGWKKLDTMFSSIENIMFRDVCIATFLMAARITEALRVHRAMFDIEEDHIKVSNFVILKRFKKKDLTIICGRCGTINGKYETACSSCKANLIYAGKKKYVTEKLAIKRLPFYIPLKEPFTNHLITRLKLSQNLLFPSPYTEKPYTRQWAYNLVKPLGKIVGVKSANPTKKEWGLYNHWFRAQRLMQLCNEYNFDDMELKAFTGIIKSETIGKYAKKTTTYREKMGLKI